MIDEVESHREFLMSKGMLSAHRRRLAEFELTDGLKNLLWERAFKTLNQSGVWEETCEQVAQGKQDPWLAVQRLGDGLSKADVKGEQGR